MIPMKKNAGRNAVRRSAALCRTLSDAEAAVKRRILRHMGSQWALRILDLLGSKDKFRHAELSRALPGITQRMLTRTLRQLERDGLVLRADHGKVPPHVDYRLTDLGRNLLAHMGPLWTWIAQRSADFREAEADCGEHPTLHVDSEL